MAEVALTVPVDPLPTSFGLECLVAIGRRYGLALSVDFLVKDNRFASAAVTTEQLRSCAERAGFRCRGLRARWAVLAEMRAALPAIVRLVDGRHAVLTRVDEEPVPQVVLQQPGPDGEEVLVTLDRAAFEHAWSGDILLIKRSLGLAGPSRPFGLETVATLLGADRAVLTDLGIASLVLGAFAVVPIVFAQLLLTDVLSYPALTTLLFMCFGLVLLIGFETAFVALRRSMLGRAAARLERDLGGLAFDRLLRLPVDVLESRPVGLIAYRLGQASTIAEAFGSRLAATALDIGVALVLLPVLVYESPALAGLALIGFALLILWTWLAAGKVVAAAAAVEAVEAERSAFVSESIGALETVKSMGLEGRQRRRWDVLTARATRLRLAESAAANRLQTGAAPLEMLTVFGTFAMGLYFANYQIITAGLGELFAVLLLCHRLVSPARHVATLVREADVFRRAVTSLGLLQNEEEEDGHSGHGVRLPLRGRVDFSNVTFSYPGSAVPALQSVSFELPPGTTLGIVGRSGAGKSTIARLLLKLHADYQGLIKLDGIDARDYEMEHLRSSLGIVLQETVLFSGTIGENIAMARPEASQDDIVHAARMAGADTFIDRLPLGYDTPLLEGAVNLSDGQRQRIAIARAVIADPRVLILDEATSALDPESEAIVNANLRRFASGRTIITISQRFSALAHADTILVLDKGEVQDMGQHVELLERCDIYSGLWQRQRQLLDGPGRPETLLPRGSHVA